MLNHTEVVMFQVCGEIDTAEAKNDEKKTKKKRENDEISLKIETCEVCGVTQRYASSKAPIYAANRGPIYASSRDLCDTTGYTKEKVLEIAKAK